MLLVKDTTGLFLCLYISTRVPGQYSVSHDGASVSQEKTFLTKSGKWMSLLQPAQFFHIEPVPRELAHQAGQEFPCALLVLVTEGRDGEQQAGEGLQKPALVGGQSKLLDSLALVGLGAAHLEKPAKRRRLQAKHVVLNAYRQVGVAVGGIQA